MPLVEPFFTKSPPLTLLDYPYVERNTVIKSAGGKVVFELKGYLAPPHWSQLACDILASKYFYRGIPKPDGTKATENDAHKVFQRIVGKITQHGVKMGYFTADESLVFYDELYHMLYHQIGAFNSPVWFNCGVDTYFSDAPAKSVGSYRISSAAGRPIVPVTNAYSAPQCSACFIQSIQDDLMDIAEQVKREMRLFKFGSGTGTNFSSLRGEGEPLSGGGVSSGVLSFLNILDAAAGATKSAGTTRRAAKMVILDDDHPDVRKFVKWKAQEEAKAHALIKAGYPSHFEGEAYRTVGGQNSNNSVRLSDKFMQAYAKDETWSTVGRTSDTFTDKFWARELMNEIAESAWQCADPGVQFSDTINSWHTCANTAPIRATNPCSEYIFLDDTACNLASLNLMKFYHVNEHGEPEFDVDAYRHAARLFILAQEILVDLSSYPSEMIAQNSRDYRPLGLGYANLGALLMSLGFPYSSPASRYLAGALTSLLTATAYEMSAEIAEKMGAFEGYAKNAEPMARVMARHRKTAMVLTATRKAKPEVWPIACQFWMQKGGPRTDWAETWDAAIAKGTAHGYRNAQTTVLAPTGTIGLLMDCDTTGIEPDFALVKIKKLAGGGEVRIINGSVKQALELLGYNQETITLLLDEVETLGSFCLSSLLRDEHQAIFHCANEISWQAHIEMVAAVQPFLSGSVSKTINMPEKTTVEDIKQAYVYAHTAGLKCVSLYRDNCKLSQPLNTITQPVAKTEVLRRTRLPLVRKGQTYELMLGGHKAYLRTGNYEDGRLGEVFIDMHRAGATLRSIMNCFAMAVSVSLQYGVPLEEFVDCLTFSKFEPCGLTNHPRIRIATSVIDFVFRILGDEYLGREDLVHVKREVLEQEVSPSPSLPIPHQGEAMIVNDAPFCSECGHLTVRNGTCYRCLNCGTSLGCS